LTLPGAPRQNRPVDSSELQQSDAGAKAYSCQQCGGEMTYDPASQQMACGHCGHTMAVPMSEGHQAIVEYDLEHGLAMSRQRGYGTPVRTTQCQECGASVSFADNVTATACDFCGSSQVLEQDANRNVLRPESLVPFQVDRDQAKDKFAGWLKGLWFRPSKLKHEARVAEMSGVYVPYWTFDATVHSDWTAQAGYYYYETEYYMDKDPQGNPVQKSRQVRKIRWQPAWGSRTDSFDDMLICASRGLPEDLARKLKTFDTVALRPYDPSFLAGWKAEEYAVELMESAQEQRCRGDVPGDTQRFLNVRNRFYDETFKHVLLPIWISAYRYNDKIYRFLVNGQTGEVTGKAPVSVIKIVLFILLIAAIIAAIVVLARR
jgi:DNA-directed RNA polymerase subunit RPC12/RpoP